MPTNTLEAKITADIKGLQKGLSEAGKLQSSYANKIKQTQKDIADNIAITNRYEKALEQLSKEYRGGVVSQKQYQKQLERIQRDEKETIVETSKLRKELLRLKREQKDLGGLSTPFRNVKKETANATPTIIEFSRVIQDAPFGIQGVANNIQQLTTNFGFLRRSAGGTIPALKTLASSFIGTGGLVFAVSTITSLLVAFDGQLSASAIKAKKLDDRVQDLNDTFQSELDLNKEQEKSLELQGKSVEGILGTRKELITAQLQSLQGLIKQQAELLKIQQIENQSTSNWEALVLIFKDAFNSIKAILKITADLSLNVFKRVVEGAEAFGKSLKGSAVPGVSFISETLGSINEKLEEKQKLNKVSEKDQRKENALQRKLNELLKQELELQNNILEINKKQSERRGKATGLGTGLKPVGVADLDIDNKAPELVIPPVDNSQFISSLENSLERTKVFTNALGSAFNSLAGVISNALATGNAIVDAFVGSIVNSLSGLISQFIANQIQLSILGKTQIAGEQAKANASGITIATQAASALGPFGIAALPGLIASTAGLINASFAPLYAFAGGGIVPGGSFNGDKVPAFVNSGEMILNNRQQGNLFRALNGNIGLLQNNINSGGFVAETVVRGQDLYILMQRASKKNNRYGG